MLMNRNFQILVDSLRYRLLPTTLQSKHLAFRWLLPPSATTDGARPNVLDRVTCLFRPKIRDWYLGMTSMAEQAYCEWYASQLYTGKGKIVELGSWLGALTLAIAAGLTRNHRNRGPEAFHTYDLF